MPLQGDLMEQPFSAHNKSSLYQIICIRQETQVSLSQLMACCDKRLGTEELGIMYYMYSLSFQGWAVSMLPVSVSVGWRLTLLVVFEWTFQITSGKNCLRSSDVGIIILLDSQGMSYLRCHISDSV
jgi:hypothetical protein